MLSIPPWMQRWDILLTWGPWTPRFGAFQKSIGQKEVSWGAWSQPQKTRALGSHQMSFPLRVSELKLHLSLDSKVCLRCLSGLVSWLWIRSQRMPHRGRPQLAPGRQNPFRSPEPHQRALCVKHPSRQGRLPKPRSHRASQHFLIIISYIKSTRGTNSSLSSCLVDYISPWQNRQWRPLQQARL